MSKAYVGYYGTLPLKLNLSTVQKLDKLWITGEQIGDNFFEPFYDQLLIYQNGITDVLNHPNITNIRWLGSLEKTSSTPLDDYNDKESQYLSPFSCPIKFDLYLPRSIRKYSFEVQYIENVATNITVIYDGNVFLAYAPIQLSTSETVMLGPEVREYLLEVLKGQYWEAITIPPCPVRTDFFVQSTEESETDSLMLFEFNENIDNRKFVIDSEIDIIMEELYYNNHYSISEFSSLMTLNQSIENLVHSILIKYEEIRKLYNSFFNISKIRKSKLSKRMRRKIFNLYELLYEYDKGMNEYNYKKEYLIRSINENDTSSYLIEYIINEIGINIFPQTNILNGIKHIEESLNLENTNYYVILAAGIGALTGILGTVVALLIG